MAKLLTYDGQVIDPTAYIYRERERSREREEGWQPFVVVRVFGSEFSTLTQGLGHQPWKPTILP